MSPIRLVPLIAIFATLALVPATASAASYAGKPAKVDHLSVPARATATAVQLATKRGFADRFWPGVNLGATHPRAPARRGLRARA